jgi:GNAT superfamily N-acetyltransferase
MEMYADYLEEFSVKHMFHNDKGFAIYEITLADCYISEIYVKPEFRDCKVAKELQAEVTKIALAKGCTRLLGSVIPSVNQSSMSMAMLLKDGFKIDSASTNFIVLYKDIQGDK